MVRIYINICTRIQFDLQDLPSRAIYMYVFLIWSEIHVYTYVMWFARRTIAHYIHVNVCVIWSDVHMYMIPLSKIEYVTNSKYFLVIWFARRAIARLQITSTNLKRGKGYIFVNGQQQSWEREDTVKLLYISVDQRIARHCAHGIRGLGRAEARRSAWTSLDATRRSRRCQTNFEYDKTNTQTRPLCLI